MRTNNMPISIVLATIAMLGLSAFPLAPIRSGVQWEQTTADDLKKVAETEGC